MRPWVRLRRAGRPAPEGEPTAAAVQAGGPTNADPDGARRGEAPARPGAPAGTATATATGPDAAPGRDHADGPPQRELTPVAPPVAPVIVPRWVQLVLLPISLLGLWALARAAGTVLLILIVASMVALILAPTVRLLERVVPRGLAILLVYLFGFAAIAGVGVLLASPVTSQISRLQHNVPEIVANANKELTSIQHWLTSHGINVHIQQQGQTALGTLQKDVLKRSGAIVSFSRSLLSGVVTIGFDLVLVLVLSIYLLLYGRQIGELVRSLMPPGDGTPEDDFPLLVQHAVSGYVRGQLLFSLVMGASAAVSLEVLGLLGIFPAGKEYAVFFGAFYGLMEFIPYIGPIIGPVPAVLVGLFQNPISAVWLIVLFVALQQLEGHVVAPQMFRISLRINPILIILALLIGYQLYSVAGALVALPVIAVIRQTVLYLRRHLLLEPWGPRGVGLGLLGGRPESNRCPDCGLPTAGDDAYCRSCGATLQAQVASPR